MWHKEAGGREVPSAISSSPFAFLMAFTANVARWTLYSTNHA